MKDQQNQKPFFLLNLEKEIETLENEINHLKFVNQRRKHVKNLRLSLKMLQILAPSVTCILITAVCFKMGVGFHSEDEMKHFLHIKEEFDNQGNKNLEQQYEAFADSDNLLYHYGKWEPLDEDTSKRKVEVYPIKQLSKEEIKTYFKAEELSLTDLLGSPISSYTETNQNREINIIENKEQLRAVMYQKDENRYMVSQEYVEQNMLTSILYFVVPLLCSSVTTGYQVQKRGSSLRKIKEDYLPIDNKPYQKRLEIKKANYARLTK